MKLTAFFLLAVCLQVGASGYAQKITLSQTNVSLKKIFKEIERQSEYHFFYKDRLLKQAESVSVNVSNASVEEVLDQCFKEQPLTYAIWDKTIIIKARKPYTITAPASIELINAPPPNIISGSVKDVQGNPLAGVSVIVRGTNRGTSTTANGNFSIEANTGDVLEFTIVGYQKKSVNVGKQAEVNIVLEMDVSGLSDVVVVGYGTQKKSLLTGAISSIKSEDIATTSTARAEQILQGKVSGVYVLPASGSPGSNMQVRIRGIGSNGNSEPLYIVDGMRSTTGIQNLPSSEIASIEVLKDAASSAIYGAEGANGVVIITTKTGTVNGSINISYSGQYGMESLGRAVKMMNAPQYVSYMTDAQVPLNLTPAEIEEAGMGTDWLKSTVETVPMQNHSLTFRGGSKLSSFLVGGSVYEERGIIGGDKSKFNRYTLRLNSDHQIKPWLNIGNRLSYSHIKKGGINEDSEHSGLISFAVRSSPVAPLVYTGDLPASVQSAVDRGYPLIRDASGHIYRPGSPFTRLSIIHENTIENNIVGNIFANIEPVEGLKFTTRYGIDANFEKLHGWTPRYWFSDQESNLGAANVSDEYTNIFTWQWENFVTYHKTIQDHNFNLLVGMSAMNTSYNRLGGHSAGMFREEDRFGYHDFTPDIDDRVSGYELDTRLSSYYGRLSYDYENKYLFNATIRRDGSSLLPPNNRWGMFPSVSLGWVVSKEDFFSSASWINNFKLRASWGQNGNLSNLISGQWASGITTQGLQYTNSTGELLVAAEPSNLENNELKWETSEQLDIGVDLAFLRGKLALTVDYFNKTTKDLLTPGSPPDFVGFPLPKVNGGNVRNRGIEFEIGYKDYEKAFKYDISVNGTAIKNEVTFLNPLYPRIEGTQVGTGWTATAFELGYPIWFFRGYKTDGIFQTQEQIDNYLSKNNITGYAPQPGEPVVIDVNGDGLISPADHTYIGSPYPDFVYGGRINLSYKGFDLLVFAQGQIGNDVLMGFMRNDAFSSNKPAFFYNERWTGPGSTNKMFAPNTTSTYIYNADKMIFDGSFMRIRQLQLGYTLSEGFSNRIKVKNLRFYISLDNYFTFTKYPGLDPEAGSNNQNSLGIDRGVYPIPRKIVGGVTLNF